MLEFLIQSFDNFWSNKNNCVMFKDPMVSNRGQMGDWSGERLNYKCVHLISSAYCSSPLDSN